MNKHIVSRMKKAGALLLASALALSVSVPQIAAASAGGDTGAGPIPKRQMEYLDRGLAAVKVDNGVFAAIRPDRILRRRRWS
ncbi:hypothetical protein ACFPYJ_24460 [Paenibacillus solisilvae]|uniref:Uncharacterized protein n=1 Tax=Paenibacillus solisilvae TaxID=2486751 RepID=A0ABW0W668_9BACL